MNKKKRARDWRYDQQDRALRQKLGTVATVMQVVSATVSIGVIAAQRNELILTLAFAVLIADFWLYLAFPAYFTLMGRKEYQRNGYSATVRDLGTPMVFCYAMLALTGMRSYNVFFERSEIIMVAAACAVVGILLWRFSRECKDHKIYLVLAVLLVAVFGAPCLGHLNHLTDFHRPEEPVYYEVVQTEIVDASRGADRYYCTVELEDGGEVRLPINRAVYESVDVGDRVPVVISEGGLGLQYAYFDADTYDQE